MIKTITVHRGGFPKEDYAWALALSDEERINVATKLVADLWAMAHDGGDFPRMRRTAMSRRNFRKGGE